MVRYRDAIFVFVKTLVYLLIHRAERPFLKGAGPGFFQWSGPPQRCNGSWLKMLLHVAGFCKIGHLQHGSKGGTITSCRSCNMLGGNMIRTHVPLSSYYHRAFGLPGGSIRQLAEALPALGSFCDLATWEELIFPTKKYPKFKPTVPDRCFKRFFLELFNGPLWSWQVTLETPKSLPGWSTSSPNSWNGPETSGDTPAERGRCKSRYGWPFASWWVKRYEVGA